MDKKSGKGEFQRQLKTAVEGNNPENLLARRLAGALPHIDIGGVDFTVDLRLGELRESAAPWNRLDLGDFEENVSGEQLRCFYDTAKHVVFAPDKDLKELPENVVVLSIPNQVILDPVGFARICGMEDKAFLAEFPVREDLKGAYGDIGSSGLPLVVEWNRR